MVCAFRGWNDAAAAASTALAAIGNALDSEIVASIDPEEYFDFQSTRPTITMTAGETRRIEWPENNLIAVRVPAADRDLVLLDGTEPNLRWRTFSEAVATAADALDVDLVITLGSLIAEVSHTLPVPITGLASSAELVDELDLERSNYEGPTGIVGVVHDLCRQTGIDSASLWAAVPHYVAAVPNPKAALALLRRLEGMTGIAVEASELEEETTDYEEQIGRAVAANPEIEELVERIEAEQVDMLADEGDELPSRRLDRARVPALPAPTGHRPRAELRVRNQADQGRRERGVLCTRATEDAEMRRLRALSFPPPGRSGGSHTSSRRWARGAARSPGRGRPRRR